MAMGHNLVILKKDTDYAKFSQEALKFAKNEYIPQIKKFKNQILAHTKMLGPGETESLIFIFPTKKGKYPFVCTFPGHFSIMNGNIIVE